MSGSGSPMAALLWFGSDTSAKFAIANVPLVMAKSVASGVSGFSREPSSWPLPLRRQGEGVKGSCRRARLHSNDRHPHEIHECALPCLPCWLPPPFHRRSPSPPMKHHTQNERRKIGRASCRERVYLYV